MKRLRIISGCLLILLYLLCSASVLASDLLMVRSLLAYPDAQPRLEEAIREQGYQVSEAERVDIDLVVSGFSPGNYRAISYGKPEEINKVAEQHPELLPFLPLQIVLFGERDTSLLVAISPLYFKKFFHDPELDILLNRWNQDLQTIMETVRDAGR